MVMTLLPGALPGARWVWSALQLGHLEPYLGRGGAAGAQSGQARGGRGEQRGGGRAADGG